MIAVGVGSYFNLFQKQEVDHIQLKPTKTNVEIKGVVYKIHKGATFEESTKVDTLMDSSDIPELSINSWKV